MSGNSNKVLERIAHFLCVNSETLPSNGLHGKMSLLYFFFAYAQKFKKQHYTDFAFEVLEEVLSDVLPKMQSVEDNNTPFNLATLEIGWSLQKFVSTGFFETDEMNQILIPFDSMAIYEAKFLIKKSPSSENINKFVFLASYLIDRIPDLSTEDPHYLAAKEYVSVIIQKVQQKSNALLKESHNSICLFQTLLDENRDLMKNDNSYANQDVLKRYEKAIALDDLDTAIVLNLCFPESIKANSHNENLFWDKLDTEVNNAMNWVYESDEITSLANMLKISIYGSILLKNTSATHCQFLACSMLNLAQENHNPAQI